MIDWNITLKVLEGVSYIFAVGIFFAALYGLKQIKSAKNIANMQAKRDAIKLATEKVHYYLTEIIPAFTVVDNYSKESNISVLKESTFEIKDGKISTSIPISNSKKIEEFKDVSSKALIPLNMSEAFASVFISKLADEEIAFNSVARTFCGSIEDYMSVIALGDGLYFRNLIELYILWSGKIEEIDLMQEKSRIDIELAKVEKGKKIFTIDLDNIEN